MSVLWHAPCGCVIEFEGQLVDTGSPLKQYHSRCEHHDHEDHHERKEHALTANKNWNRARNILEEAGEVAEVHYQKHPRHHPRITGEVTPKTMAKIKAALRDHG